MRCARLAQAINDHRYDAHSFNDAMLYVCDIRVAAGTG